MEWFPVTCISSGAPIRHVSSPFFRWHHTDSLKWAMVGVFVPEKMKSGLSLPLRKAGGLALTSTPLVMSVIDLAAWLPLPCRYFYFDLRVADLLFDPERAICWHYFQDLRFLYPALTGKGSSGQGASPPGNLLRGGLLLTPSPVPSIMPLADQNSSCVRPLLQLWEGLQIIYSN